ncbi:unnamed protein product [Ectocarpus sp. CCAP 1310/34]|nr:unnamed protein product [Ectocarpus sp. CCAP 1310/34]
MTIDYIEPVDPRRLAQAKTFADGALFSDWEAVACPTDPATGLRELDLSRVVCMAGCRTCKGLRQIDLPGLSSGLFRMISDQTTPGKPDFLLGVMGTEMQAGKEAVKSPAEIFLQTKRALLDATAKYLFTCPSHAGMMHTDDLAAFSVVSGAKRARTAEPEPDLASLLQAIEEEGQQQPEAASNKAPAKKKLPTIVSIGTQVRD